MILTRLLPGRTHCVGLLAMTSLAFSSCEGPVSTGQKSLAGAAAGAAAGGLLTGRGQGALIGAGVGAIAGALIGHSQTEERRDEYYARRDAYYARRGLPYGRPTRTYGLVYSPYPPHSVIDVYGVPPGAPVVDPSTGRVFRAP